jgi:AraC-like DNA-binding protein
MKMPPTIQEVRPVAPENHNRAEPVEIWRARNFIREYSDEKLSLAKIAKAANISANYLSEKFKQVTGENLVRYIARTRVEKACALLKDGNLRISEIAFAVGFQSLSQFNRVFKKSSGISPTEFRADIFTRTHAQTTISNNSRNRAADLP